MIEPAVLIVGLCAVWAFVGYRLGKRETKADRGPIVPWASSMHLHDPPPPVSVDPSTIAPPASMSS